ncbi:MAG: STT3 domain-containing protein [archaeon]|nr:STT3 domain-containing protein [archaeon]
MALNLKEKWEKVDKKQLLIVAAIFLLAFAIRAHLMKFELFFEFDTYWHARMVSYIIQTGTFPLLDPLAYYQIGGAPIGDPSPVFWYLSAAIYKIVSLGGIIGGVYDKDFWILVLKILPAFFGAIICVGMYFLFKEIYEDKKAGIVAGVVAASVPAFVYRTMAGFFEEDSLGFLWLILGFYFMVKAFKQPELNKEHFINVIIAGIFFGIMAWTWGMFLIIPIVMVAYIFGQIILMFLRNVDKKTIKSFFVLWLIVMVIFTGFAFALKGSTWINSITTYVAQYAPITQENITRAEGRGGTDVLSQTVGEENTGRQFFGTKYNALIIFAILAIPIIIWRLFRKKNDYISLFVLIWILLTLFMAWNKLKFTYTLGLPIAAGAGVIAAELFAFIKNRSKIERQAAALALFFMVILGVASATMFMTQNVPNIESALGWKPALKWMQNNTPDDSKFFNWWDEGHWITFIGERGASTDNRNYDFDADINVAKFIIWEGNEEGAFEIVKGYKADYVILSDDLLAKGGALAIYAFNTTNFSDPRLGRYFGIEFYCNEKIDELNNTKSYECGPNTLTQEQMLQGTYVQWNPNPNQLLNGQLPAHIYRAKDNSRLFIVNAVTNNTMGARLWFNDPTITRFTEVYSNEGVKIFKVNY